MSKQKELLQKVFDSINEYCEELHDFKFNPSDPCVRLHEPSFGGEEICAALEPMLTTFVTMGKKVKDFEKQYAAHFGPKYSVMNNSGSSANLLALSAIANPVTKNGLKPGDEVIVPALSWSTTVWPVIQNNLVPVFVDCDPDSFNFDLNKLEKAIGPKTRAIMLVHVYGNPCDMDSLMNIVKKHNLILIEDCCEAMGAYYGKKAVGTFGSIGTYSFYYSHHITTLEGGICVTDDFELAETMRILRAHGWTREADSHQEYVKKYPDIDPRFIFVNLGYNIRPTECQAAMGAVQLPKLDGFIAKRREAAKYFQKELSAYGDYFHFQKETPKGKHVWFGFPVVLKKNTPFKVKDITSWMNKNKIETRPIIAGNMAKHPALKMFQHRIGGDLSEADNIMKYGFAFGNHHYIDANAQQYVTAAIHGFMREQGIKLAA